MNTSPKQPITISARYLGPIFSLDGNLSDKSQNLIFARNGTGKSFLSRGLRYLDKARDDMDIAEAARILVSEEASDGKGNLKVSRGTTVLGDLSLQLQKSDGEVSVKTPERIFHVFSEDFIHEELREKDFEPDGNIENQIAIDSGNIKLKAAQEAVITAERAEAEALAVLGNVFEAEKIREVREKASVNKNLRDYKNLTLDEVLDQGDGKPPSPDQSFTDILNDLDSLKSIPTEPVYPTPVVPVRFDDIEFEEIEKSLQKVTSPSTVSETIKQRVESHRSFFETGTELVTDHDLDTCPYCEQDIQKPPAASVIQMYIDYFQDEEAKHKNELNRYYKALRDKKTEITNLLFSIASQRTQFDNLKSFVPSQRDELLADCETEIEQVCAVIARFQDVIEAKSNAIDQVTDLPSDNLDELVQNLAKTIKENNKKIADLQSAIESFDEERKTLQRRACDIFRVEFARSHWSEIDNIASLRAELKTKSDALVVQENSGPKTDARERVAETFELLLGRFFAEKYVFDHDSFVLKRGDSNMARGAHRTLSDGEKTAIAFCYFIACIHRKVKTGGDYQKLFLVFDDPVTSMSYDFVFNIAQTLKNLSISRQGDVSINPSRIDGNTHVRPELIILTHSSYFFNISITNRVVKEEAAFSLYSENDVHKLKPLRGYIAPFQQQLKDIVEIAENDKEPNHQTANAVRSVLEAVGHFCRPDKSDSLTNFITFLAEHGEFEIKSVMINSLNHGTYCEETPPPDDLKLACEETIKVVEKFATGQLEVIRNPPGNSGN